MKRTLSLSLFVLLFGTIWAQQSLNPIVGDSGYISTFGTSPNAQATECERITSHLQFVHQRLSALKESKLTSEQAANRKHCLNLLAAYISEGRFPENREFPVRRPIFIDDDGTYCAVGYLIRQTAGAEAAQAIDARHHGDYLLDMDADLLRPWADANGFSLKELAMIQPSYGPDAPIVRWKTDPKTALTAAGLTCPPKGGMLFVQCEFDIIELKPINISFSNDEFPALNQVLEKCILEAEIGPGSGFGGQRQRRSANAYIIQILYGEQTPTVEYYEQMPAAMSRYRYYGEYSDPYLPMYQWLETEQKKHQANGNGGAESGSGKMNITGTIYANRLNGKPAEYVNYFALSATGDTLMTSFTGSDGKFVFNIEDITQAGILLFSQSEKRTFLPVPFKLCTPRMDLYMEYDEEAVPGPHGMSWTYYFEGC